MSIMGKVQQIRAQIEKLVEQITAIQEKCSHPAEALVLTYGSNTGNYDPSADCYWINHHCELCDKKWTVYK